MFKLAFEYNKQQNFNKTKYNKQKQNSLSMAHTVKTTHLSVKEVFFLIWIHSYSEE